MKVVVYPADSAGCGHVRLIWAAKHLARTGHDVEVILPSEKTGLSGMVHRDTGRLLSVEVPPGTDVVVMQRVLRADLARDAIPMMRAKGVAVVVDMDDALSWVDPANPAFAAMHPRVSAERNWDWAALACRNATLTTVATPRLGDLYGSDSGGHRLIRNCVPAGFLAIPRIDSDVIGWAGLLASHPRDFGPLGGALGRLEREGAEFAIVGPASPDLRTAMRLEADPYATGPVQIEEWPFMISQTIGIGIAPLADTQFNTAKSHLKPLEMMALGIPVVASMSDEYAAFMRATGVGRGARKPNDWYRHLRDLRSNEAARTEESAAGRAAVEAQWTLEDNAWRWWEAWSDALRLQRAGRNPITRKSL